MQDWLLPGRCSPPPQPKLFSRVRGPVRIVATILLFCLQACGDGGTGPGGSGVGPEGGTVSLAGGAVILSVPPGALSDSILFTAGPAGSLPSSRLALPGSAYEIGPPGTTFSKPVFVTLSYDVADLPNGVWETELRLQQVAGASWGPTMNSSVDLQKHTVSGLTLKLGRFGAVALPAASVELYPPSFTLGREETKQILAVVRGPSGESFPDRHLTWISGNEAVAKVDSTGLVTGVGAGSTLITASADERVSEVTIRVFDCSAQGEIPTGECLALISLYDALTLGEWRTTGWMVGDTGPCAWRGVTCQEGSVSEIRLISAQYPGSIPLSIGDFPNLVRLDLSTNRLTGLLPRSLGNLASLRVLSLASNDLSGSIPSELGQLSKLEELDLHWNKLSGPLPPALGSLGSLTALRLNGNQISGAIPAALGNLAGLRVLALFDNKLSGPIPPQLGGLANLERLTLSMNELTGGIPRELGSLSSLVELSLRYNLLSGSIPAEIGALSGLQSLLLDENGLAGPIPLAVAQLGGLIQSTYRRTDCKLGPPGNEGLTLSDTPEFRGADLDGDGLICGVPLASNPLAPDPLAPDPPT